MNSATAAPALPFPLPPTFPPGVNPETYRREEVTALLKRAAYFSIFNLPSPHSRNQPVTLLPGLPFLLTAVNVNEALHRFEVAPAEPSVAQGVRAANRLGESVGEVQIRWTPIPDDFAAAPDREPPLTLLNPFRSQRFTMLNGGLCFNDHLGSGFRAFGAGRTFPVSEGGAQRLRLGAVVEVLEGFGACAGLAGAFVLNGHIEPPHGLALNLLVRLLDPQEKLRAHAPLAPLQPWAKGDQEVVFMYFLGEPDPQRPVNLRLAADGRILGSEVHERLRLVHLDFALGADGPRHQLREGPVVGTVSATLHFNPLAPARVSPIQTTQGVFRFCDPQGCLLGTVNADMVEGRAMRTELAGTPMPIFKFAGFGPLQGGTGCFAGADGMMSMNAAISLFPRTLSNLYVLRFYDPDGRFRAVARAAWN